MHPCLVIRHGLSAEDAPSGLDADRTLTPEGVEEIEEIGEGLAVLQRAPTVIVTSPYRRAVETAELIAAAFGGVPVEAVDALAPGALPQQVLDVVAEHCPGDRSGIAVVGHEPDLGRFVSHALSASERSYYSLRKGAACLLEFPAVPRAGNATLEWALEPGHLLAVAASVRRRLSRRSGG
jgi:phosphohistidine phosphatase